MMKYSLVLYLLLINSLFAAGAMELNLESGDKRNILVELYTSEGCSSCPPAEEFLNSLKNTNDLWNTYIPVAFHVDYWDYIGWKDPYAMKKFGYRQSHYAKLKRASTVYTPAFMVNGNSWRRGLFSRSLPGDNTNVGKLKVSINDLSVQANFKPLKNTPAKLKLKLNIAILGMGLTSHIKRGENEGRTARHEFVVVGFDSFVSNNFEWKSKLPGLHYAGAKKYAIAVWVSEMNNPTPIQAVGGELPGYKR